MFDIERVLSDAAKLAAEIMERDRLSPGYALAVMRALIVAMPASDVNTIIKLPKPISVESLVG